MGRLTKNEIALRSVTDDDREFLLKVYEASREIELSITGWDAAQRRAFVEHQFTAQDAHYREHYTGATFDIILCDDEPAGRLCVHRGVEHIAIMDVTVLPEYRNRGIATRLVRQIIDEAGKDRTVVIHIEPFNPSQKLFGELGFTIAENDGMTRRFEWRASNNS